MFRDGADLNGLFSLVCTSCQLMLKGLGQQRWVRVDITKERRGFVLPAASVLTGHNQGQGPSRHQCKEKVQQ